MMPARKADGHFFSRNRFYEEYKVNHTNRIVGLSVSKNINFQYKIQNFLPDFYKIFSECQILIS